MSRKKICITGDRGFIGRVLMEYLSSRYPRTDFIGIDRKKGYYVTNKNVILYETDINQWLPSLHNVDTVIHLAALPSVRDSEKNASQVIYDNILASQKIIKQCINVWHPKKLLIASSSSVYNGESNEFMNETDAFLKPLSIYASSKLAVEKMTQTYVDNGSLDGIQVANMRFFTNFGKEQRDELAIRKIITACIKGKVFTLYGDGNQRRDFIEVTDTCEAIQSLMNCDELKYPIYNIGTGENHSINEIIRKVSTLVGMPSTVNYQPPTVYDTMYTKANIDRIKKDTGWEPKVKFDIGLRNQVKWQSEGGFR